MIHCFIYIVSTTKPVRQVNNGSFFAATLLTPPWAIHSFLHFIHLFINFWNQPQHTAVVMVLIAWRSISVYAGKHDAHSEQLGIIS